MSNTGHSSAPRLMSWQADSHLTPTFYSSVVSRLSHIGSWPSLYSLSMDYTENTPSNSSVVGWCHYLHGPHRKHCSSVACAVVTLKSCLLCHNLVILL
jgi:hypothetical protein